MTYESIITVIESILSGIEGIKKIYTEAPSLPDTYPCAVIRPVGHTNEIVGVRDTLREYSFAIDIIGALGEHREDTQVKIRGLVDEVINELERFENISQTGIDWAMPTSAAFRYQMEPSELYIAEISYRLKIRYNRHQTGA